MSPESNIDVDLTAACYIQSKKPPNRKFEMCNGPNIDANRLSRPVAKPAVCLSPMTLTPIVETCMTTKRMVQEVMQYWQNGSRRPSESLERLDIEAQSDEIFDAEIVPDEGVLFVSCVSLPLFLPKYIRTYIHAYKMP
jgi:hypothetical protein